MVHVLARAASISATAIAGEVIWYRSRLTILFSGRKSTHKRIPPFFLGITTECKQQSVGLVTGVIIPAAGSLSSSFFNGSF